MVVIILNYLFIMSKLRKTSIIFLAIQIVKHILSHYVSYLKHSSYIFTILEYIWPWFEWTYSVTVSRPYITPRKEERDKFWSDPFPRSSPNSFNACKRTDISESLRLLMITGIHWFCYSHMVLNVLVCWIGVASSWLIWMVDWTNVESSVQDLMSSLMTWRSGLSTSSPPGSLVISSYQQLMG